MVSGRVVAMCRTSPVGEPAIGYLIVQRWPGDLFVIDLVVGHGGAELGVPVDQPLAAKDLARLEQVEERAADGARAKLVEREPGPLPVAGTAHQPELAQDPLLVLVFPGPDSLRPGPRGPGRAGFSSPPRSSRFSTTAWVAMPAWSVPGIQRTS